MNKDSLRMEDSAGNLVLLVSLYTFELSVLLLAIAIRRFGDKPTGFSLFNHSSWYRLHNRIADCHSFMCCHHSLIPEEPLLRLETVQLASHDEPHYHSSPLYSKRNCYSYFLLSCPRGAYFHGYPFAASELGQCGCTQS